MGLVLLILSGCGIYSFSGGQFSGAKTFSVSFFKPQTPLASQVYAQRFTEALKDLLLSQSPLKLTERDGELQYEGAITEYKVAPIGVSSGTETASKNRLTITVKVKYTNQLEKDLSFEKTFSKFADFDAGKDLFSVQEDLWQQINDQLLQEIYNASVGNW
jgi:Lipopolysaccharide-assembly